MLDLPKNLVYDSMQLDKWKEKDIVKNFLEEISTSEELFQRALVGEKGKGKAWKMVSENLIDKR